MRILVRRFLKNESGATAIEYGLIAAGLSVAIVAVVPLIGDEVYKAFEEVRKGLAAANN